MEKQTNTFCGDHHHHPNNDDDEEALFNQNEKKKKAMTLSDYPETHAGIAQTLSASTSIIHDSDPSDDNNDGTDGTLPSVKLSSSQKANLSAPYKYSLIAKVLGKKVRHRYFSAHLLHLWAPMGKLVIIQLGYGFFLLKFSDPLDYNNVLDRVPWLIAGCYIILRPWVPNFKPSEATITHAAVWVRLPELPIEYYDKEILSRIGSTIGSLVKIDAVTERQEKGRFARLCIQVDLNRPLLPQIKLGGLCQRIEYEGLHILCFHCGRVGHLQQDCLQHPSATTNTTHHQASSHTNSVLSTSHETSNALQNSTSRNSSHATYGPWVQVHPRWRQRSCQTAKESGQHQSQVPNRNVAIENEPTPSGSRFQVLEQENLIDLTDEPKPPKGKSAVVSVSISSPHHIKMNVGQNNTLVQKHLQPGEETSIQAEDMPLAMTKLPKPEEVSTGHIGMPLKSKVPSELSTPTSSNLPQDSLQLPLTHQTNPQPISHTISSLNVSPSFISNHPQPTQEYVVSPSPPVPLVTTSTSTTNPPTYSATTSINLNQLPQPSTPPRLSFTSARSIEFHSRVMQLSTKQRDINSIPVELEELSTEGSPTVFSINSTISNIGIGANISWLPNGKANQHKISFIPTTRHPLWNGQEGVSQYTETVLQSPSKKLLSWNCRGAGDTKFMRAIKDLIHLHQPSIILLFETRISGNDADQVIKDIGFSGSYRVDPVGFDGGIWLLWREEDVLIKVTSSTSQNIHATVQVLPETLNWMLHGEDANTQSWNQMLYGVDANADPLSQPWASNFFYTSENLNYPPTSEWVPSY